MIDIGEIPIVTGEDLDALGKWYDIIRNGTESDALYRERIRGEILAIANPARARSALYAKAGETVTCELGHPIARSARDIVKGEAAFSPGQFEWLKRSGFRCRMGEKLDPLSDQDRPEPRFLNAEISGDHPLDRRLHQDLHAGRSGIRKFGVDLICDFIALPAAQIETRHCSYLRIEIGNAALEIVDGAEGFLGYSQADIGQNPRGRKAG